MDAGRGREREKARERGWRKEREREGGKEGQRAGPREGKGGRQGWGGRWMDGWRKAEGTMDKLCKGGRRMEEGGREGGKELFSFPCSKAQEAKWVSSPLSSHAGSSGVVGKVYLGLCIANGFHISPESSKSLRAKQRAPCQKFVSLPPTHPSPPSPINVTRCQYSSHTLSSSQNSTSRNTWNEIHPTFLTRQRHQKGGRQAGRHRGSRRDRRELTAPHSSHAQENTGTACQQCHFPLLTRSAPCVLGWQPSALAPPTPDPFPHRRVYSLPIFLSPFLTSLSRTYSPPTASIHATPPSPVPSPPSSPLSPGFAPICASGLWAAPLGRDSRDPPE